MRDQYLEKTKENQMGSIFSHCCFVIFLLKTLPSLVHLLYLTQLPPVADAFNRVHSANENSAAKAWISQV